MKKQAQEISSGVYTYRHRCEGGVDIHDVFVKKSTFRVLLLCVGAIFILANVFHALLSTVAYSQLVVLSFHYFRDLPNYLCSDVLVAECQYFHELLSNTDSDVNKYEQAYYTCLVGYTFMILLALYIQLVKKSIILMLVIVLL